MGLVRLGAEREGEAEAEAEEVLEEEEKSFLFEVVVAVDVFLDFFVETVDEAEMW